MPLYRISDRSRESQVQRHDAARDDMTSLLERVTSVEVLDTELQSVGLSGTHGNGAKGASIFGGGGMTRNTQRPRKE